MTMTLDEKLDNLKNVFMNRYRGWGYEGWDQRCTSKDLSRLRDAFAKPDPVGHTKRYMGSFADPEKIQRRINAALIEGRAAGQPDDVIMDVVNVYARHLFKVERLTPVQIAQLKANGMEL